MAYGAGEEIYEAGLSVPVRQVARHFAIKESVMTPITVSAQITVTVDATCEDAAHEKFLDVYSLVDDPSFIDLPEISEVQIG